MSLTKVEKQITGEERAQVDKQVKIELIEHLYRGCLPGTISGIPVGIAIFIDFYNHTPFHYLLPWYIFYNVSLLMLTIMYFAYQKYQKKYSPDFWLKIYSTGMIVCATTWGMSVFLIPDDIIRQYFAFIALFLISTGYATGTIGQFRLCLATLAIIVIPLIIWCLLKASFFYYLVGFFSAIYIFFMTGINKRSTIWFKDSLKLKLENSLVSYQANHDILTELPNQRLLIQLIDNAIEESSSSAKHFALVCFSLNRIEMINDSLGHHAGDAIIKACASRLQDLAQSFFPNQDATQKFIVTISRKDTFNLLILPFSTNDSILLNKFFSILDEPFYLQQQGVKMTASIGVAIYPSDANSSTLLFTNADAAMLRAKQYGGNRIEFYRKEINEQLPKQLEIESGLHEAIARHQFEVFYQPLVEARTNKIVGSEALIRWKHPERGYVSPINFIPLAEETGLIVPIGTWVLEEACRQNHEWQLMGFSNLKVAVNLAGKQIQEDNIVDIVKDILGKLDYNPRLLELEITETAILDESVMSKIKQFSEMGVGLAVDDFGTGYSGLSYLKRFSIDKLKIDQSFVRDIPHNKDSIAIVSAIIAMAKELNLKTLAEGVEEIEQLEFLRQKGCDFIQGYYYSKPVTADEFTTRLLQNNGIIEKSCFVE